MVDVAVLHLFVSETVPLLGEFSMVFSFSRQNDAYTSFHGSIMAVVKSGKLTRVDASLGRL